MHELNCPSCGKSSNYNFSDYLLLCPFCSASFLFDSATHHKEVYQDHYIIPNQIDAVGIRDTALEWLRRLHHRPANVENEFFVVDLQGFSLPVWVISAEAHTAWKGLIKRDSKSQRSSYTGADYLNENGQFRRGYRWAILGRHNICESWGLTRLHEPNEEVEVEWDGFPLDSTLSRGILEPTKKESTPYEERSFFEFKEANGLAILGIQVSEQEALRRAKKHIDLYHYKLSKLNVDYLIDYQTELEIAGIQLIHIPIWRVTYIYRPTSILRYFFPKQERHMVIDGYNKAVLRGELSMLHSEKLQVNTSVSSIAALVFLLLGVGWHPAFLLVSLFASFVAALSFYKLHQNKEKLERENLLRLSQNLPTS